MKDEEFPQLKLELGSRIRVKKQQQLKEAIVHENIMVVINACINKRGSDLTVYEALILNTFPEFVTEVAQQMMENGSYGNTGGNFQA